MRLLALNHYFDQDLESLSVAAGDRIRFDVMPFEELRAEALRVLPIEVATGLEAFARPELEPARRRYATILREILEDRFTKAPFDGIVMPSDTFFYVRAAPPVAHGLGVPFIVVQKETTISELTMREHAPELRRFAPPLADLMTVCSERHRQFWLRAGAEPDRVLVTGQPRFDIYRNAPTLPSGARGGGEPVAVFFSYAVDAYHPDEGGGGDAWGTLHRQTEAGLHELARRGWRVLIKPHPQQSLEAVGQWRERAGDLWDRRIVLVDPAQDARRLIVDADVVIGFQTTALLEAMLAGRPVVYTGWDERASALGADLIPFAEWADVIAVQREPTGLADTVESLRDARCNDVVTARRVDIAKQYLGPLDGAASDRTLAAIANEVSRWQRMRQAEQIEKRRMLAQRRPPLRFSRRSRAGLRLARRRVGTLLGR